MKPEELPQAHEKATRIATWNISPTNAKACSKLSTQITLDFAIAILEGINLGSDTNIAVNVKTKLAQLKSIKL